MRSSHYYNQPAPKYIELGGRMVKIGLEAFPRKKGAPLSKIIEKMREIAKTGVIPLPEE